MKIKLIVIAIIFSSCNVQVNNNGSQLKGKRTYNPNIAIDEITEVSIFENFSDNVWVSKDIINSDWNFTLSELIDGFDKKSTENLSISSVEVPEINKVYIQIKYPKNKKPKNYSKIRETVLNAISKMKSDYLFNKDLILGSSREVAKLLDYLNNKKYFEFYSILDSSNTNDISYEDFLLITEKTENLGFSKTQREYLTKVIYKFEDNTSGYIDIIEYKFWLKSNHNKYESFNFKNLNGQMKLIGYHVYF